MDNVNRRKVLKGMAAIPLTLSGLPSFAQTSLSLHLGSGQPTSFAWVGLISTVFKEEIIRRSAGKYNIRFQESYGGQLYKNNATLSSVAEGIVDIGWVFSPLEGSRLPLNTVYGSTPFCTESLPIMLNVMNQLHAQHPSMRAEWEKNNVVFLGANGLDNYNLYTKTPINSMADLRGKRLGAPGVLGNWIRNTGATAVDGNLSTYYTDAQTGVIDGCVSIATGILPAKIYEVLPYITMVNLGAGYLGALAINKDRYQRLPSDLQQILYDSGQEYSRQLGLEVMRRYGSAFGEMVKAGAQQNPKVQISNFPDAERQKWIQGLPNLSAEWVKTNEARGLPAREIMISYMDLMRKNGAKPARAWDKEIG
jgi:TRAP-type C4-dicarboxylate transport system substrate-binding protein